jgi:hypothetical protein
MVVEIDRYLVVYAWGHRAANCYVVGMTLAKILGGLAVAVVVASVVASFDDLRRYVRISTM